MPPLKGKTMKNSIICNTASTRDMSHYNIIWKYPSKDHTGQMPLGNGDIAAGVYAIEDDALYLLLSKNDAFTYNGDIFKTGRVKISLDPNPFAAGKPFLQTLDLNTGSIRIEADDVKLHIWADANRSIYHIQIDAAKDISVKANSDLWERLDDTGWNLTTEPIDPATQDVRLERNGNILWYFSVGDRSVFPAEMKFYDVEHMISNSKDPYRFNTFGNLLESPDMELDDGMLSGYGKNFDVRIHALTMKSPTISDWITTVENQSREFPCVEKDWQDHCQWWSDFWNRSWITVADNKLAVGKRNKIDHEGYCDHRKVEDAGALVAQSYNVFRYLMACQSRGTIQTKFNGGLFTQPLRNSKKPRYHAVQREDGVWISHEDARLWGRRFTFQNQRLLYWPMLMSGDTEMMSPFFDYYWNLLPIRREITKAWFGHEGTYYRENIEPTGGERDCGKDGGDISEDKPLKTPPGKNKGDGYYHSYYFTCGLETVAMMIDYVKYSDDTDFRDNVLVPFAREILLFFDQHYERDADGKLLIDPGMVLETWWVAVNAAPDIAGLLHNLDELLAMEAGSIEDRINWKRFRAEIPDVHLHEINGRTAIAPAKSWARKNNNVRGLFFPVFPFRRYGIGLGTKDIIEWTMQHRTSKNSYECKCWTQDQIHWAYAGNAQEAKSGLIQRYSHASSQCRFLLYGSEDPDSCPDFDHFGSGSIALQRMLVQEAGEKILLLPAWPADWDAEFKLHVSKKRTISGKVINGELTEWTIDPADGKKDVVVYKPQ